MWTVILLIVLVLALTGNIYIGSNPEKYRQAPIGLLIQFGRRHER